MIRKSRTIAAIIHSLFFGTGVISSGIAVATTVVSCSNENQPKYWVDKLDDAQWRQRAVKRLDQFLQDAMTKVSHSGSDAASVDHPDVKPLVDKIIDPLVRTYRDNFETMDKATRVMTIRLIASCKDKRGEPALKQAMEDFIARPKTDVDDQDLKWAVRAQEALRLPELSGPMLQAFQKFQAHTMLGGIAYKDLNDAMMAAPDRAWIPSLESMLDAEVVSPDPKNKTEVDQYRDQLYWQTVSAQLLGELGSASSVLPLMKVVLDPAKGDVAVTALMALVKLGAPAVQQGVRLLTGESKELAGFHAQRLMKIKHLDKLPVDDTDVQMAATILGTIGRKEALEPMLQLLKSTHNDGTKAVLLREIAKIPATMESKEAFKRGFEQLPLDTPMPSSGRQALTQLVEQSVEHFHDASMVDWLLDRVSKTQGNAADKKDFQAAVVNAVITLAQLDQVESMKQAVEKYGTPDPEGKKKNPTAWWSSYFEGPNCKRAEDLLKSCDKRWPCYLTALEQLPIQSSERDKQFVRVKAANMLAAFGDPSTAERIVERMALLEDPEVRAAAAQAIDYLLIAGSTKVADQLNAIIQSNVEKGDRAKLAGDTPLKEVMYRIRSRAE